MSPQAPLADGSEVANVRTSETPSSTSIPDDATESKQGQGTPELMAEPEINIHEAIYKCTDPKSLEIWANRTAPTAAGDDGVELPVLKCGPGDGNRKEENVLRSEIPDSEAVSEPPSPEKGTADTTLTERAEPVESVGRAAALEICEKPKEEDTEMVLGESAAPVTISEATDTPKESNHVTLYEELPIASQVHDMAPGTMGIEETPSAKTYLLNIEAKTLSEAPTMQSKEELDAVSSVKEAATGPASYSNSHDVLTKEIPALDDEDAMDEDPSPSTKIVEPSPTQGSSLEEHQPLFAALSVAEVNVTNQEAFSELTDVVFTEAPPLQNDELAHGPLPQTKQEDVAIKKMIPEFSPDPSQSEAPATKTSHDELPEATLSSNDYSELQTQPLPPPKENPASLTSSIQQKKNNTQASQLSSSPLKPQSFNATPSRTIRTPNVIFTTSNELQSKDVLLVELKAMKIVCPMPFFPLFLCGC